MNFSTHDMIFLMETDNTSIYRILESKITRIKEAVLVHEPRGKYHILYIEISC